MGVEATLELMKRVNAATQAEDDQDHVPMFVYFNPQVPSRIRHVIEKNGPDPGPILAQMAARLAPKSLQCPVMRHIYTLRRSKKPSEWPC